MGKLLTVLGGIGTGALLMYLFDPNGGRRRRALVRDKAVGISNDVKDAITSKSADLRNRAKGVLHEAKGRLGGAEKREDGSQTAY